MKSLLVSVVLGGCALSGLDEPGDVVEQDSSSTTYVDILDFSKTDQGQWYDLIHSLNHQFDDVCGDTFCEGDWSNLTPLTFGCSVSSKLGNIKACTWTFAASSIEVDQRTAAIVVDAPTFQCPIVMKTTAVKLETLLAGSPDSLHAALPGAPAATPSIYDQLSECFSHPIGSMPGTFATEGNLTYVAGSSYYTSEAGQQKWFDATTALVHGFDNICGDTFCGGDFGDLQALDFECSITKSTGNVKSCAWVFGGSYHVVAAHGGALQETSNTFRCNVAIHGTLSQLLETLTAPGTTEAINRSLPGVTTTAYDALLGCLP
jgi:hypothetical protein